MKKIILISLVAFFATVTAPAVAKDKGAVKKAEAKMMAACKKEFPDAVKGKTFKAVADWVETEEHGDNKDKFKQTQCYKLHEDWEAVAQKHEKGEEHEHKS